MFFLSKQTSGIKKGVYMSLASLRRFSLALLTSLTLIFSQSSFGLGEDEGSSFPSTGKLMTVGLVGAAGIGTALILSSHHGHGGNNPSPTPGSGVLAWVTEAHVTSPIIIDTIQTLHYEITNTGTGAVSLVISNFIPPITRKQDDVVNNCGDTLNPGQTCAIELEIAPTELGHFNFIFAITDANGPSNLMSQIQFDAIKNPTPPPLMITSPGYNSNMDINQTQSIEYTVTNQINSDVGVSASILDLVGQGSGVTISKNSCSPTLAKNASCNITVLVDPGDQDGFIAKNLNITDNFGGGHSYQNPINIQVSSLFYDFNLSNNKFYSFTLDPFNGNIIVRNNSNTTLLPGSLHISVNPPRAAANGLNFNINPDQSSCITSELSPGNTCNFSFTATFTGSPNKLSLLNAMATNEVITVVTYDKPGLTTPIQLNDFVIDFYTPSHFWFLTLPPNTDNYKKLPENTINSVTTAPYDQDTAYVATDQGLAFTQDLHNGTNSSWKTITTSNGLPNNHVGKVFVAKANGNNIFAGTDDGLAISTDTGTTWKSYKPGIQINAIYANGNNVFINDNLGGGLYFDAGLGAGGFTKDPQFGDNEITAIVGVDNKVYVGVDSSDSTTGLWVKDFSNPSSTWTHLWDTSSVFDVFVSGNDVYILSQGISPVDLHVSHNGGTTFSDNKFTGTDVPLKVFAIGTDVYVITSFALFHSSDIDAPTPVFDKVFEDLSTDLLDFWVAGNHALLASSNGLFDVNIGKSSTKITASGNLASNIVTKVVAENAAASNGNNIYAATLLSGVSVSTDGAGSFWSTIYTHPANDVARFSNYLLIAPRTESPKYIDLGTSVIKTFAASLTAPIRRINVSETQPYIFAAGSANDTNPSLAVCSSDLSAFCSYPPFFRVATKFVIDLASNINQSGHVKLYVATNHGLFVDDSSTNFAFTSAGSQTAKIAGIITTVYANNSVVYAFNSSDGKLYRSTDFVGDTFVPVPGVTETAVSQISVDDTGAIFLATNQGLRVITAGTNESTYYTSANSGIADNIVDGVFLLGNQIFAATQNGLSMSLGNSPQLSKTLKSSKNH